MQKLSLKSWVTSVRSFKYCQLPPRNWKKAADGKRIFESRLISCKNRIRSVWKVIMVRQITVLINIPLERLHVFIGKLLVVIFVVLSTTAPAFHHKYRSHTNKLV